MFTRATQCMRGVLDPPVSAFSLALYRHPFLYTLFSSWFTLIINNKNFNNNNNKYGNIVLTIKNYNPSTSLSFIPAIASTFERLHSEFIRLLFLQVHRETDRFFQLQEFFFRNPPVDYSTSVARRFRPP
jgi:hypothetical protein